MSNVRVKESPKSFNKSQLRFIRASFQGLALDKKRLRKKNRTATLQLSKHLSRKLHLVYGFLLGKSHQEIENKWDPECGVVPEQLFKAIQSVLAWIPGGSYLCESTYYKSLTEEDVRLWWNNEAQFFAPRTKLEKNK